MSMFDRERCECCGHYVYHLSDRWWCNRCEEQFADVVFLARQKLTAMGLTHAVKPESP